MQISLPTLRPSYRRFPLHVQVFLYLAALGAVLLPAAPSTAQVEERLTDEDVFEATLLWPDDQREFAQEGPGFLLSQERMEQLMALGPEERAVWIEDFLDRDPEPSTPENELRVGIEKRRLLVEEEIPTYQDVRARLLFVFGPPVERELVDCAETFRDLEIWTYPDPTGEQNVRKLILFRPQAETPFRLWLPVEGKRALYVDEMAYYLEQWEELKDRIVARRRIDRFFCRDHARQIDRLTGIDGLYGYERNRPEDRDFLPFLHGPDDLRRWAMEAAATRVEVPPRIEGGRLEVLFPERDRQRMITRLEIYVDDPSQLGVFESGETKEIRLVLDGTVERKEAVFERFRNRFQFDAARLGEGEPVVLVAYRRLRPHQDFLLRLEVQDEITGKTLQVSRGISVPAVPERLDLPEPEVTTERIEGIETALAEERLAGESSVILIPPVEDVIFGLWRAEALVTGREVERVRFLVDDQAQLTRKGRPFTAELRLSTYPREQTIRAEGLDASGEVVASDEVVINIPRGELRVRILEPERGVFLSGEIDVSAEVVVPEEKRVAKVEFSVDDELVFVREDPPWEGRITVPESAASNATLSYLTVTAELEDGLRAEDVRFLNAPEYLEEVDVDLVELYTTVTKRGRPVTGLEEDDFEIYEDGIRQEMLKFELVDDLPLSVGIVIDTSGSMFQSLGEAQRAATEFLERVITPQDRTFAVAFADRPEMLMTRTSDVGAVTKRLETIVANGATALHDAVVTSLYYFRGVKGRRAIILLSDGEDTASALSFREAREYARRSGVAIYTIGLQIGGLQMGVRDKLTDLSDDTGGRTFFINKAEELHDVYAEIEKELRSQYLLAYSSNQERKPRDEYREVEVKVDGGEARTIKGYYP